MVGVLFSPVLHSNHSISSAAKQHRAIYRSFAPKATPKFAKRISSETCETCETRMIRSWFYQASRLARHPGLSAKRCPLWLDVLICHFFYYFINLSGSFQIPLADDLFDLAPGLRISQVVQASVGSSPSSNFVDDPLFFLQV